MPSLFRNKIAPESMKAVWEKVRGLPKGGRIMGSLLGRLAPYTGTIHPEVLVLEVGHAKIRIEDQRRLRNHLGSIHAMALANLGELATGGAFNYSLPPDARAILISYAMDYVKKARGPIVAEVTCTPPTTNAKQSYPVHANLTDERGEVVARAVATWLVGPRT